MQIHFALKLVSSPTAEPVLATEAEAYLRETSTGQRSVIEGMITAARETAEDEMGRSLLTQTWDLKLDRFPPGGEAIKVPRPPLQSVTFIKYVDGDGATTTLSATSYTVDVDTEPGRVAPSYDENWPEARDVAGAVTVRFIAGATAASVVPRRIRQAILASVARQYERRGDEEVSALPDAAVRVFRGMDMRGLS